MKRLWIGFSSLLCAVACSGTDVPVGAASGGTSGTAGAGGGAGAQASAGAGGAEDPRKVAASYASTELACSVDSDCCVVVDNCTDTGYLVAVSDKDKVRALLDGASMDRCVACIPPSVEVLCEQGRCVAKRIEDSSDHPAPDGSRQDHCGSLDAPSPTEPLGSEFGCGASPR